MSFLKDIPFLNKQYRVYVSVQTSDKLSLKISLKTKFS